MLQKDSDTTSPMFTDFVGIKMKLKTIKSEGLAQNSYIIFTKTKQLSLTRAATAKSTTNSPKKNAPKSNTSWKLTETKTT